MLPELIVLVAHAAFIIMVAYCDEQFNYDRIEIRMPWLFPAWGVAWIFHMVWYVYTGVKLIVEVM